MIIFKAITEDNFDAIISMKRPDNENYIASNEKSLAQAWLYRDAGDVFPFAIYADDMPVGFMMLDADFEERALVIWRIMFPVEHQNKGYGTLAVKKVIELARESGKFDCAILTYKPGNDIARRAYEKAGFAPTGEICNGEIEMRLEL